MFDDRVGKELFSGQFRFFLIFSYLFPNLNEAGNKRPDSNANLTSYQRSSLKKQKEGSTWCTLNPIASGHLWKTFESSHESV